MRWWQNYHNWAAKLLSFLSQLLGRVLDASEQLKTMMYMLYVFSGFIDK